MLYHFTYQLNGKTLVKICSSVREADVFFQLLIASKVEYIKIITYTRRSGYDKK